MNFPFARFFKIISHITLICSNVFNTLFSLIAFTFVFDIIIIKAPAIFFDLYSLGKNDGFLFYITNRFFRELGIWLITQS